LRAEVKRFQPVHPRKLSLSRRKRWVERSGLFIKSNRFVVVGGVFALGVVPASQVEIVRFRIHRTPLRKPFFFRLGQLQTDRTGNRPGHLTLKG
jgi:hypothetical protein